MGIQWGRARGPILESTGDGFCTFVGGTAAAVGLKLWKTTWVRGVCLAALALDLATLFFTLTRSVWIGALSGIIVAMMLSRRSRRVLIPGLVVGAVVVGVTLAASPTLRTDVVGRAESQSPVWDRQNTDLAALRILTEMPLSGVGWENFINVAPNYMVQQPGYPLSGYGIEVHNVFLSHAAELGIPGLLLWLMGFLGAVRRGLLPGTARGAPGGRLRARRKGSGLVALGRFRHRPLLLGHRQPVAVQPGAAQHAAVDVAGGHGHPLYQPPAGARPPGEPGPCGPPPGGEAGIGAGADGPEPRPGLTRGAAPGAKFSRKVLKSRSSFAERY